MNEFNQGIKMNTKHETEGRWEWDYCPYLLYVYEEAGDALPYPSNFKQLPPGAAFVDYVPPPHLHFDEYETIWNVSNDIQQLDADHVECYFQGDFVGRWVFRYLESAYYKRMMSHEDVLNVLRDNALLGTRRSFYEAQAKRLGLK